MQSGIVVCQPYGNLLRWEYQSADRCAESRSSSLTPKSWYTTKSPELYRTLIKLGKAAAEMTKIGCKTYRPVVTHRHDTPATSPHGSGYISWIEYSFYRPTPRSELYVQISVVIRGEEHSRACYYTPASTFIELLRRLLSA